MTQWSYSGLKEFEGCARRYHEVKILKNYPRQETEQTLYGTTLHKHAENYILYNTPLPKDFLFLKPILESLKAMPGTKLCEYQMGLKEDLTPCAFEAKTYWVRGVADIVVLSPDRTTARVYDYKSGSDKYPDTDQLLLMSLMLFQHFPTLQSVSGGLLFVLKGTVSKYKVKRHQAEQLWWRWRERVARIEAARANDKWLPKSGGLCKKYCPVKSCEYNGAR
jgi:hypothetical protein